MSSEDATERVIRLAKLKLSKAVYNQRKLYFIIFHKVEAMSFNLFHFTNSSLTLVRINSVIGLLGVLLKVAD